MPLVRIVGIWVHGMTGEKRTEEAETAANLTDGAFGQRHRTGACIHKFGSLHSIHTFDAFFASVQSSFSRCLEGQGNCVPSLFSPFLCMRWNGNYDEDEAVAGIWR